jgi:hypothetical protein
MIGDENGNKLEEVKRYAHEMMKIYAKNCLGDYN